MVKSIRIRLLVWSSTLLAAVVVSFACILYWQVRAAKIAELDAVLDTAAASLDATLRYFPRHELTGEPPPIPRERDGPPRGGEGFKGDGPRGDGPRGPRPDNRGNGEPRRPGFPPFGGPNLNPPVIGPDGEVLARPRDRLLAQLTPPPPNVPDEAISYFGVWRADGKLLKGVGFAEDAEKRATATPVDSHETHGEMRERILIGPHDSVIVVGKPIDKIQSELAQLRWLLILTGVAVMGVGVAGGWFVSRRIFRPVASISATASRISADNLSERIDESKLDIELKELAETLNGTFERLQAAFERQTQFTADASHELRTPLAVIRSQAELALLRDRSPEEYKAALDACLKSSLRMTDLVERLLTLARADAGHPGLNWANVSLDRIVNESVAQLQPLANEKSISLRCRVQPTTILGDAASLNQLVTNLVSNALKYNKPGGKVRVTLDPTDGGTSLIVADTGDGIPKADRDKLFERFFRVDKARSRAAGGTGLGLAICKAIVDAHRGWIDVKSTEGKGSEFRVWLPSESTTDLSHRRLELAQKLKEAEQAEE